MGKNTESQEKSTTKHILRRKPNKELHDTSINAKSEFFNKHTTFTDVDHSEISSAQHVRSDDLITPKHPVENCTTHKSFMDITTSYGHHHQ